MKIFNCMKKRVDVRGLSPVIASVLLILMVLVLAVLIFLWARGFVSEQVEKFGKPIEQICSSVDFEVQKFGSSLEVVNRGNVDIHRGGTAGEQKGQRQTTEQTLFNIFSNNL